MLTQDTRKDNPNLGEGSGILKRKALARMKFVGRKEKLLTAMMDYTEQMRLDFDGIIKLIYDDPLHVNNDGGYKNENNYGSAFKLLEGREIDNLKSTLKDSPHENRYYIIMLVKAGMVVDCLDKMMNLVKKDTFGSQSLKEIIEITKKKAAETQHPKMCSYLIYQLGRINYLMRDFRQAKVEFKMSYQISEIFYDRYFLMKCSEWLGKT